MITTSSMVGKEVSIEIEDLEYLQRGKLVGLDDLHYTVEEGEGVDAIMVSIPVQKVVRIMWDNKDDDEY